MTRRLTTLARVLAGLALIVAAAWLVTAVIDWAEGRNPTPRPSWTR